MAGPAPNGMQVERVLEDLIARLSRSDSSKEVRAALIEARRLRSVTLTWTAIPPPPDARREMLSKVMDLVARVGVGAAPRPSAEVRAEVAATLTPPPPPPSENQPHSPRSTTPPPFSITSATRRELAASIAHPPPPAIDEEPTPMSLPPLDVRRRKLDSDPPVRGTLPPHSAPMPDDPDDPITVAASPVALEARARVQTPISNQRRGSPIPFRKAPSAQDFAASRGVPSITAIGAAPAEPRTRRVFGSGQSTQTNLTRPLRTTIGNGVSLVRPQATAWQAYPRVPGAKLKLLWRDADTGGFTALLHLAPGTTLPARRHAAVEEMLLIEGNAVVGSWEMRPGEYCRAETGSVHDPIRSDDGCTFFVTGSEHDELLEDGEK